MPNQDRRPTRRASHTSRPEREPSHDSARREGGMAMRQGVYRLPDDVARRVHLGHPWIFREAFGARKVGEPTGSLVDLVSNNRNFLARGYVDSDHPIAVRIISRDPDERVHPGAGAIAARFQ